MSTNSRRTILLATDHQHSVLSALVVTRPHHIAYTPYGHRPAENGLLSLLGFNGELPDPMTGHYHLGNGYRQFNPLLMRFNSPDSWSPFGRGGINSYAYCLGDPVNGTDRSGRTPFFFKPPLRALGLMKKPVAKEAKTVINTTAASANTPKPPPLDSPKTINDLTPEDFKFDDINLDLFEPRRPSNIGQAWNSKNHVARPHPRKHFPPKPYQNSHGPVPSDALPTFDEYLRTSTDQQLSAGFNEVQYAIDLSPNSDFLRIGRAYEQELLNRALRKST
ncbi:RHS repeat-associated core domain-containing protein [Pseudomonas sp. SDO5591_S426]